MINKIKTGLLVLMFVVSLCLGAMPVTATNYAATINTYDGNYNEIIVDSVDIYSGTAFDVLEGHQTNVKSPIFSLADGLYKVVIQKQGYEEEVQYFNVEGGNTAVSAMLYALPDQGGDDTGDDDQGDVDEGTTEPNMKVDFEIKPDDEVKPGDEVTIEVELENDLGYDAEEVVVEATIFAIADDGDDDLEEETQEFTIGDDNEKLKELTFVIPYDVKEGEYNVEVLVTWEDEQGVEHNNNAVDVLEVEKEKHDVNIINAYFGSETVEPGRTADMAVEIANIGKNDENVRIKVESPDLGIEEWSAQFELEEGETATQYIPFSIPENADLGKYFVNAIVTYNDGADSAVEYVTLTVADGAITSSAAVTLTPVVTTVSTEGDAVTGFEFTEDAFVIGGLIVGILVVLAIIAVVGKDLLPKKATIIESSRKRR